MKYLVLIALFIASSQSAFAQDGFWGCKYLEESGGADAAPTVNIDSDTDSYPESDFAAEENKFSQAQGSTTVLTVSGEAKKVVVHKPCDAIWIEPNTK